MRFITHVYFRACTKRLEQISTTHIGAFLLLTLRKSVLLPTPVSSTLRSSLRGLPAYFYPPPPPLLSRLEERMRNPPATTSPGCHFPSSHSHSPASARRRRRRSLPEPGPHSAGKSWKGGRAGSCARTRPVGRPEDVAPGTGGGLCAARPSTDPSLVAVCGWVKTVTGEGSTRDLVAALPVFFRRVRAVYFSQHIQAEIPP